MTEQEKREKVIRGLECCLDIQIGWKDAIYVCQTCPYTGNETPCETLAPLMEDALALLKEQEPRVMTLGDLRDIGSVWELGTPPYLWMEINPTYRWKRGFWVAWREIYDMIDGLHPTYDADNYKETWRCWTSRPTKEQMEALKWE